MPNFMRATLERNPKPQANNYASMPPAPIGAWVHMRHVALVTDSTAGLSAETATLLGVAVVPASFAFAEQRFLDGDSSDVFARMESTGIAPRTFGVAESAFRE